MNSTVVSQLLSYPVKSARGNICTRMSFDVTGPRWDRRWMVVDESGRFQTQRKYPRMCHIATSIDNQGLILTAPEMPALRVGYASRATRRVIIWRDEVEASDCGDQAAQWLSDYLQKPCRLVYFGDKAVRAVNLQSRKNDETKNDAQVGFADAFPILLISEASLELLNSKLNQVVSMDRFRPNIVVAGCHAHAEDQWQRIAIGEMVFELVSPCSRCIVPSIDQLTARKNPQILDVLRQYRTRDREIYFGMNALHNGSGEIAVGDVVTVLD